MPDIGLGITQAVSAYRSAPMREAQRQEAEERIAQSKARQDTVEERESMEMQMLRNQARQANAAAVKQQSFDAFRFYESDGNVRHLNTFFQSMRSNPMGKQFANTVRVDALTASNENDRLLQQAGYEDPQEVYNSPELSKNLVVAVRPDGTRELSNMTNVYAATGYTKYMEDQQLEQMERTFRLNQMVQQGNSVTEAQQIEKLTQSIMASSGASYSDAYAQVMDMKNQSRSAESQMINSIARERNIDTLEAAELYYNTKTGGGRRQSNEQAFIDNYISENPGTSYTEAAEAYAARTPTSTQREADDIESVKDSLDEMNFFDLSMSDLSAKDRANVHRQVARIEDLRGIELSTEDKRVMRDLRNLTTLGTIAGTDLTDAETGIIDRMINKVKAYTTNEVGGKAATSAYESFRNIFRNALYGATLTQSEIDAFNAATGTLGQQTRPLLAQFKTQMLSIKDQLESVRDYNDPYIAHYYLGSDIDNVDDAIRAIEERIGLFDNASGPAVITPENAGQVIEQTERRPLADILQLN